MRRNVVIGGVIVLLLALVAWWKLRGDDTAAKHATAESTATPGGAGAVGKRAGGARAAATKVSISGRVILRDGGAPVEGAHVTLIPARDLNALLESALKQGEEETPLVTTGADGAWRFDDVDAGTYTISATARGLLPATREVPVGSANVGGIDLVVGPGGAVASGTVSDVLGGPIPGAKVVAQKNRNNPFAPSGELVTFTDEKGTYAIALEPGNFMLSATHDAYTKGSRWIEMTTDPVTIDFTLTPGATIRGQVVTTAGDPVPDAWVTASGSGRGFGGELATSDAHGEFTLKGLRPGALSLSAMGGDYSTVQPTVVEVGIGEQVDGVKVVVEKGFTIAGTVVEKGTAKGIGGVRVGAFSFAGHVAIARDATAEDGTFAVKGLRPASYMLFALGDEVMPEVGKAVEVVDQDVSGVTLEMASGVTISGRVEPATIADVAVEPKQVGLANIFEAVKSALVRGESDATGQFTLRHAPPGAFTLTANTTDGRKGSIDIVVGTTDVSGLVVKLEKRASIAGRVVDAGGAAVTDVEVGARLEKDKGSADVTFSMSPDGHASARTRADGSFLLIGLDGGTYRLSVTDRRGRLAWANPADKDDPRKPIEVEVAAATDRTGVVLAVEKRDGVIKGIAVGADGKPAADVWITASLQKVAKKTEKDDDDDSGWDDEDYAAFRSGGAPPVLTTTDGKFEITGLRRGTYRVDGDSAKGSARGQKDGVKTGDTITLQLARLGALAGKVTLNGSPVATYDIECETKRKDFDKRVTDPTGAYQFERMPPGDYACSVVADAGHGTAKVSVPAGDATLDIALVPWSSLTGTVVSVLSGEPIAGVKIVAKGVEGDRQALADLLGGKGPTSDKKGVFVVPRVSPGKGEITIMPATGGFETLAKKDYEVSAGQRLDLGTIKIIPPRSGDAGTLGIGTEVSDGKLMIVDVRGGGPAEAAGILAGDRIVSINGLDVATLTPEIGKAVLSSGAIGVGQQFVLGIERAGATQQIPVVSVKW